MKKKFSSLQPLPAIHSISAAAKILEISVHTIRMYEKAGLLLPHRDEGKHRRYSDSDLERIRCIRKEINSNKYSIAAIQKILSFNPCWREVECSPQARINCPAYKNNDKPCWAYKHENDACTERNCHDCMVYQTIKCDRIKEKIIKYME